MSVSAVVFDLGNVVLEWNPQRFYDREIGPDRRAALFAAVDLEGMNERVDMGADFMATIYAEADKHPEWRDEIRMWHDRWIEMASPEIPHSVRLLRALRAKGVPVFALTNFGVGSFEVARKQYPFLNEFDRLYVSGVMQMMKPDPRIYAALEADCGVAPEGLLFADDRADNVEAAAARGWQVHLFKGPAGWAKTLVDKGLLSAAEAT